MNERVKELLKAKTELFTYYEQVESLIRNKEKDLGTLRLRKDKEVELAFLSLFNQLIPIGVGIFAGFKYCSGIKDILITIALTLAASFGTMITTLVIGTKSLEKYLVEGETKECLMNTEKEVELEKELQKTITDCKGTMNEIEKTSVLLEEEILKASNDIDFLSQRLANMEFKQKFINPDLTKTATKKITSKNNKLIREYEEKIAELKVNGHYTDLSVVDEELIPEIIETNSMVKEEKPLLKTLSLN
jgi:hypothetical protein